MNDKASLALLACQIAIPNTRSSTERDQHLQALQSRVDAQLTQQHAALVVLPELASVEYSNEAFANLSDLAERDDGASYRVWSELSVKHQCTIAYSYVQQDKTGDCFIASAIVGPDGKLIDIYQKQYLAQFGASSEKDCFKSGNKLVVFEVNGVRIAPIICADIRFPELARALTLEHGIDVILHQGAYARDSTFASWHHFAITRALENQVYLVSINRAGKDFGHSVVVPPWMDENHPSNELHEHDEQFAYVTVDKRVITKARSQYPFLQDKKRHI